MQEFFKTTLVSKFIKYLLMVNPLPNVSYLNDYDIMVEGNFYLYHGKIYKCTLTGIFNGSQIIYKDYLYCSESIYCNDNLVCTDGLYNYGGKRLAEYELIDDYFEGKDILGFTEHFHSTKTYYDENTHIKLGNYLRLLKSMYGLDLMSLYNCYCNYYVDNVDLTLGKLIDNNNKYYKVTLVPIKFNRTYTIGMNCSSTIFIKPVIYDKKLIRTPDNKKFMYDNKYTAVSKFSGVKFNNPFKVNVFNTDPDAQSLEKFLYLAIQFPVNTTTPITVLEGDFNNYLNKHTYDFKMFDYSIERDVNKALISQPSLLMNYKNNININGVIMSSKNTGKNHELILGDGSLPFSDRLVEYLIGHTIDMRDEICENISRVTNKFGFRVGYEGSWNTAIRGKLFEGYIKLKETKEDIISLDDILGYVDKDIEEALNKGYLKYANNT